MDLRRIPIWAWVTIGVCLVSGVGYWWWTQIDAHNKEAEDRRKGHAISTIAPTTPVDPTLAQATQIPYKGMSVDYNSQEHTQVVSTKKPSPSPTPEPADVEPLIMVDGQAIAEPSPTPRAEPADPESWLPNGRFIPCVLQNEIDSGHIGIPILLIVTEDIYQRDYGIPKLIIPAGSQLMSFAGFGYHRDRITAEGSWHVIFVNDGTEVEFSGTLCDMEFNPATNQYGLYDKSPGIKGTLIESDQYVRLKGMLGTLLSVTAQSATSLGTAYLQRSMQGGNSVNFNVPDTSYLTSHYIDMIVNGHNQGVNDTLYVQVPAGKQAWVLTTSVIEPGLRSIGARLQMKKKSNPLPDVSDSGVKNLDKMMKSVQKNAQPDQQDQDNEEPYSSSGHFSD